MAASPSFVALSLILRFLCSVVSCSSMTGFSAELIHRDAPESPFHDPTSTPSDRLLGALRRSASRAASFRLARSTRSLSSQSDIEVWSPIINNEFEYMMTFDIGSQNQKTVAIVDTGSNLIWVLCHPCTDCYDHTLPLYNPTSSNSYNKLQCRKNPCSYLERWSCDDEQYCKYNYEYADDSSVKGILSTETLIFESTRQPAYINNIIFGCTHHTSGHFNQKSIGLVGLGSGKLSLVRQLSPIFGLKFSYCLPYSSTNGRSRIHFGSAADVSGPGAVTTPLFINDVYYLKLEAITVEGAEDRPIIVKPNPSEVGNIIVDTGAMYNHIDVEALSKLMQLLIERVPFPPMNHAKPKLPKKHARPNPRVPNMRLHRNIHEFELCFHTSEAMRTWNFPKITFQFVGGALFVLKENNAFIAIDRETTCLTILSNAPHDGISTLGGFGQLSYLIGYDLDNKKLTFLPDYC